MRVLRPLSLLLILFVGCATPFHLAMGRGKAGGSPRAQAYAHYLASVMHKRNGRFEQASVELRKAAELDPKSSVLVTELIRTYLRAEEYENALAVCKRASEKNPNDAPLWIVLGWIYHHLERYDEAIAAFGKAMMLEPDNSLGYEALVLAEEKANDLVASIDIYQKMVELRPSSANLHFQLGVNLARIHDEEGARNALEKALTLNADHPRAHYVLGLVYLEMNQPDKAVEQFDLHLAKGKSAEGFQAGPVLENKAAALARLRQYESAADAIKAAADADDEDAKPRRQLGYVYLLLRLKRFQEAADAPLLSEAPITATLLRALARKGLGTPYQPLLDSLDTIDGDVDAESQEAWGQLLSVFGRDDAGPYLLDGLQQFQREGVKSKRLALLLGRTLMALDKKQEAVAVLRSALETFGDDKSLHYYLADFYADLKQYDDAIRHCKASLALDSDNPDAMNLLGYTYAETDQHLDEAERLLTRALEKSPNSGYYLDSLGWVFYRKGDGKRAVELIRRAVLSMNNDDAVLRDHLGDAYLLKGEPDKALAQWRRARRLDPKLEGIQEKIDRHQKGVKSL